MKDWCTERPCASGLTRLPAYPAALTTAACLRARTSPVCRRILLGDRRDASLLCFAEEGRPRFAACTTFGQNDPAPNLKRLDGTDPVPSLSSRQLRRQENDHEYRELR
jgi:hypothetical protein